MGRIYTLNRTQLIRRPLDQVFEFFSNAGNLEEITPPFLKFKILTPQPIPMQSGVLIDYQLRLYGVTFKWQTLIEAYDPPRMFSDTQMRGPYKFWHHTHEFQQVDKGVLMLDRVRYQIPYGILGRFAHQLFVRRTLEQIFDYRCERIGQLLPDLQPASV